MKFSAILLIVFSLMQLVSCTKHEVTPDSELLLNTNFETGTTFPLDWYHHNSVFSAIDTVFSWATEASSSSNHSVKMSKKIPDQNNFTYVSQTYGDVAGSVIPTGKNVELSVKIKAVNLAGGGVSIAVRSDKASSSLQFQSTQGNSFIGGTFDWTEYTITLNNVSPNALYVTAFFVYLPRTTGTVYFDDASLKVVQ